jgi:hypothetical protein
VFEIMASARPRGALFVPRDATDEAAA